MKRISLALVSLFGLVASAFAQTSYNRFGPVNGVLVGDSSTYYTSAADSSDILALWSGTCSISTFLRGDGACAAATITGQALTKTDDTNVTLTLGGSPSTALVNPASLTLGWTGQLAVGRGGTGVSSLGNLTDVDDTNVTLTLGGTPTGALINSTSITAGWTGTLAVGRGGIGVGTLTGIAKGNGTSAFTAAASSDVIGTWTGTCNSTTFLRADGTCQTVGSGSGSVTSITFNSGLTASPNPITTTGTASLDLSSTNAWTGLQTFGNAGTTTFGGPVTVSGAVRSSGQFEYSAGVSGFMETVNRSAGALGYKVYLGASGTLPRVTWDSSGNLTNPGTGLSSFAGDGTFQGRQFSAGGATNSSTAVQLCHSSSGYGTIGINTACQSGGGYNYGVNDAAGQIDFGNIQTRGWTFRTAAAGTGTITFTDIFSITNAGNVSAPGSVTAGTSLNGASLVVSGATATVNGQNICLANGTNCPASSGPTTVYKASATDRSSTTALASDPDLVFTAAATAVYKVDFCLLFGGVSTGTQGFKFAFNRTTSGSDSGMWHGGSRVNANTVAQQGTVAGFGTGDTTGQLTFSDITVGNASNQICGSGTINASNAVAYAIQWAQNDSEANATRLNQGSFLTYQRIN